MGDVSGKIKLLFGTEAYGMGAKLRMLDALFILDHLLHWKVRYVATANGMIPELAISLFGIFPS